MKEKLSGLFARLKTFLQDDSSKMKWKDFVIVGLLILTYGVFSFWNLGSTKNPQTFLTFEDAGNEVMLMFDEETEISKIRHYAGDEPGAYQILISMDGEEFEELGTLENEYSFTWVDTEVDAKLIYLKFVALNDATQLGEIQLYDQYGEKIEIKAMSERGELLLDEKDTVPANISYMNSTYFDEIYFARSAYQYVNDIQVMEWVHPPLGKLIQAIPIVFLGMTPFAYRLMGNIAGILMIFVLYAFAKKMFKNRKYAIIAGLLMMFDTFHFTQTRMGTVDSFLVLFMMISAYFMYGYLTCEKHDKMKKKLINLALCGLFFAFATCVKWTGLYLGLGLCIMFFGKMIYDFVKTKGEERKELRHDYVTIILACIVFFIIIPCIIYASIYFLAPNVYPYPVTNLRELIEQIKGMFSYHSTLTEEHPFSSSWYTWPLTLKPVWYYVSYPTAGFKSTIAAIGNPAIWWVGVLAFFCVLVKSIQKRKLPMIFLTVILLCLWLPYAFIGRCMFLYHYFPVIPFLMLAIVEFLKMLKEKLKSKWVVLIYLGIVILFFIFFYPVASGYPMPETYIDSLQWLKSWIF